MYDGFKTKTVKIPNKFMTSLTLLCDVDHAIVVNTDMSEVLNKYSNITMDQF